MKNILLSLFLILIKIAQLSAQDEKIAKLSFSEPSEYESNGTTVEAFMKDKQGNIYVIKYKISGFGFGYLIGSASVGNIKHKFFMEIYSPNLKKLISKEVEIPNANSKQFGFGSDWGSGLIGALTIDNEPYLFVTYVNKKSNTRLIQAIKVKADCTFDKPIPLYELANKGEDNDRSFVICQSEDESKLMIVGIPDVKAKQNIQYYVSVYDTKFEQVWSRGFALPISEDRSKGVELLVGNTGRMFMKTNKKLSKKEIKENNGANTEVAFFTYNKKDFDIKTLGFEFPTNKYIQFMIQPDSMDIHVSCYATFSKDKEPEIFYDPRHKYSNIGHPYMILTGLYLNQLNLITGDLIKKEILLDKKTINYFKPQKVSKKDKDKPYGPTICVDKYTTEGIRKILINRRNEKTILIQTYGIIINMVIDSVGNKISETIINYRKYGKKEINPTLFSKGKNDQSIILVAEYIESKDTDINKCYLIDIQGNKSSISLIDKGEYITFSRVYLQESQDSLIILTEKGKEYRLMRLSLN